MIVWAVGKVVKQLPLLPPPTAQMLFKAEQQTVNAALNAKSTVQLREATNAALWSSPTTSGHSVWAARTRPTSTSGSPNATVSGTYHHVAAVGEIPTKADLQEHCKIIYTQQQKR